ncbi:MAG: preprotein translocase subunit SecE [Microscillaceae bacterium]|nr:preprotein translocase subunit SecE [Microscillaceae bacterium]MDW8460705.1 preprotein translocase subunit SecE [Cytophagales bacterium]
MKKIVGFFTDSYTELKKHVKWLKYSELQSHTTLVIVASIIFALLIGMVDLVFDNLLKLYYELF